jgi:molybdopterin-guanine dinucleotide biosynthesis protein MobB
MMQTKAFGIVGWKNSGKTTLIVALVNEFVHRGLRVSTIKHAHHAFDIDLEGKDSHRHRLAGATEVLVASGSRWALMHELRGAPPPCLADLVSQLAPCDLILVEGFKGDSHQKIEVAHNHEPGRLIADQDPGVLAIVTNRPDLATDRLTFALDDIGAIADFISKACDIAR